MPALSARTQAGQDYGTALLWTRLLLVPVLYVNQEMVLRLGAVSSVGHARLILERFGRFWGAFSVIDLFVLSALTIVTEFIGISLALDVLGLSRPWGVIAAAVLVMAAVSTGSFRNSSASRSSWSPAACCSSRFSLPFDPPLGALARDFVVPTMPTDGVLSEVLLLIIAIVGTTVAPWQLFFQQSYVVDKRITSRFIAYERIDLGIGIGLVIIGAVALMAVAAATFASRPEYGNFTDAAGVAAGLARHVGRFPAVLFALALIDACVIGASAVSLATAYAIGDVLSLRHSLRRKPREAKAFYAVYCGFIALAVALVLAPGTPLGLLTNAVQALAGVLLPSATVFLLLLCNDRAVLGPWVNGRALNFFTGAVIAVLVMLSVILTAAVLFPGIGDRQMLAVLIAGGALAMLIAATAYGFEHRQFGAQRLAASDRAQRHTWRMPPLDALPPARLACWPSLAHCAARVSHRRRRAGPVADRRARHRLGLNGHHGEIDAG